MIARPDPPSRPLLRVRTFLAVIVGVLAWFAQAVGAPSDCTDLQLELAQLVAGVSWLAAGYFTIRRRPGGISGIVKS